VVREPALIRRALDLAIADGCRIFVEVGGHPTLAPLLRERGEMAGAEVIALPTMRREEPVPAVMDETAAALRHPFTGSTRGDLSEVWST
jgi:acyl transferase domain-containing protein